MLRIWIDDAKYGLFLAECSPKAGHEGVVGNYPDMSVDADWSYNIWHHMLQ